MAKLTKKPIHLSHYANKNVLSVQNGNDWIRRAASSGRPFMACRLGKTELNAMVCFDSLARNIGNVGDGTIVKSSSKQTDAVKRLCRYSGFFPESETGLVNFVRLMQQSCKYADLIGVWFNYMEDYMIDRYAGRSELTYLRGLEPWYSFNPWTSALQGKRVVIVHPFADTIHKQYLKRKLLFPGTDILPEFQLRIVKAVQTLAGTRDSRFESWFDALYWMECEIMKEPFDIAIIGCGAYGLPLAAKLKEYGKQAVHLGGATQLLFGICGARWDHHEIISKLFNENWIRPSDEEKPAGAETVEGACYW